MHIGDRYGKLFQMSYITRDMDAAVAHARSEVGIGDITVTQSTIDVLSFGRPTQLTVKAGIANDGVNQFEIIEPVAGPIGIYTEEVDLSAHILNFHHIGIAVTGDYAQWQALLDDVRASGDAFALLYPPEPDPEAKLCFCYVDTRKRIGHYTEYLWVDPSLRGVLGAPAGIV